MAKAKSKKAPSKKQDSKKGTIEIDINKLSVPFTIFLSTVLSTIALSLILIVGLHSINSNIKNYGVKGADTAQDSGDNNDAVVPDDTQPTTAKTSIDDDPYLGNKDKAKIAIIEFSDYECPFCKKFHQETFEQIIKNYVDTDDAIFVYRDLPLSFHEPAATKEAIAAECVQELGDNEKYFKFGRSVYDSTESNGAGLDDAKLSELAGAAGVDENKFKECLASGKFDEEIKNDSTAAQNASINGTPGFVVGVLNDDGSVDGQIVSGAQPYSVFESAIKAQLEKAN
ncbi:MAG: DSBA oxidoreductase [candidate division WS6 bacterium GW2011_GWA2_37_6]|uniref:DSBA oxidoreductase n=1 Tax=candidate division WS6 bacterium GW2011_GWA2_37_6 TaxID=1619087 RepID=A0A0G0K3Q8_9BACT|nr:MAG: DSBA oxidoreductase [candidate division WS6 bacterium GW2011_GWA2_37_6]